MREDRQAICTAFCEVLRMTSALGHPAGNPLVELRYIGDGTGTYDETVRPIFEDGVGENGWYDINVSCDSDLGAIIDIVNQFVRKML